MSKLHWMLICLMYLTLLFCRKMCNSSFLMLLYRMWKLFILLLVRLPISTSLCFTYQVIYVRNIPIHSYSFNKITVIIVTIAIIISIVISITIICSIDCIITIIITIIFNIISIIKFTIIITLSFIFNSSSFLSSSASCLTTTFFII